MEAGLASIVLFPQITKEWNDTSDGIMSTRVERARLDCVVLFVNERDWTVLSRL